MKYLFQGGVTLDFFCMVGGENAGKAEYNFHNVIDVNNLQVQGILVKGSDGKLHMLGIEDSNLEVDSVVEVDEDTPKKYRDYQVGSLVVNTIV